MEGKINDLQVGEDIKCGFFNLIISSSDEGSEYNLEQVYQYQEDSDVEISSNLSSSSSSSQDKKDRGCQIMKVFTKEEEPIQEIVEN